MHSHIPALLLGLLLALVAAVPGRTAASDLVPVGGWTSELAREHPLVGRIYATSGTGAVMDAAALRDRVASAQIVLLGEVHDNADHHRLRAPLLAGKRSVVFEQLRADQADLLDALERDRVAGAALPSASELLKRLAWEQSGWPDSNMFEPLFAAALDQRMAILGGDPARARIRDVARNGRAALAEGGAAAQQLEIPLGEAREAALLDELEASHCGLVPRTAFGNMALAQRYRDTHLALRVGDAVYRHGSAVLITGNGHVRRDRGVPWYLARQVPPRAALAVMFVEVDPAKVEPAAYVERGPEGEPVADILVFTPRAARPDPCEEMRRVMGKRG
jgi:uncharacterized iron-regulated protein